ncbi:tRNA (N6-isopentenyl adenosine(37)-C2)-methylthiotransferase MiaB [Effusibacillus lacus]|uniref:tRNA-2-methylthio-N(6)-dimethylallyladenosine synthase n=1 Tax=Effusibacillus lacus TaxID=1348429 RepID=A0A292YL03_9BACL|nr:tRNA (N6-isopentenyl adenosine(37)-C2)-methylthiotransferase MiaB [Effusibacillus lacus]TCS75820.1 tRNA-2-methylthio-N6-dimethylallyladenosine synthase [Effusibacillus lacus]GAX91787.1 tRNA (N6-isopentenyl adenosine(37)-C2)-methylthiotransferase MiaB [Effusibacillus lacus]
MSDLLQLEDLTQAQGDMHRPTLVERESIDYKAIAKNVGRIGEGKKYHIKTYGCQMNEHDTEIMAGMLEEMGYTATNDHHEADFILFNTCAVRENAEDKVFGEIGRLKPLKNRNPQLILGLCGCMAQEKVVQELVAKTYPWVDVVFGTHNLHQLPELIDKARNSQETIIEVWDKAGAVIENLPKLRKEGIRAWVNIQYGCNKFCTYCIVPYTRGRERSRLLEDVVAEVKELAGLGFKEITLLGQNVNDYGIDLKAYDFADLLAAVNEIEEIERIRFTTSNPWNFTDKLIQTIANCEKVAEHIHLPVQSGNNTILRRMNRGYTREFYLDLVGRIRAAIPDVSLTTDIIVGFPGETEEQFLDTLQLVEEVRFDGAYTFIYSPRAGTPATRFKELVSETEQKDRLQRLIDVQNRISREINDEMKNQIVEVLVEGESKTNPDVLQGRTRTNKIVLFSGTRDLAGQIVQVRITEPQTWLLKGELVPQRAGLAV